MSFKTVVVHLEPNLDSKIQNLPEMVNLKKKKSFKNTISK